MYGRICSWEFDAEISRSPIARKPPGIDNPDSIVRSLCCVKSYLQYVKELYAAILIDDHGFKERYPTYSFPFR